jgi:hypothetical protein
LGFSWQPQDDGNTVIRGGVGLFFDTPNLNIFLSQNPGNGGAVGLQGNPAGPNPVLTLGIPTQVIVPNQLLAPTGVDPTTACVVTPDNVSPCGLFSVNQNLRNPHNVNYSLNIQRSFGSKVVTQLGYVGSAGRKLILLRDINQPALNSAGANVDAYTQQISRPYYSAFLNYGATPITTRYKQSYVCGVGMGLVLRLPTHGAIASMKALNGEMCFPRTAQISRETMATAITM